jgi:DNA-binding XRE family transcriptional regulator
MISSQCETRTRLRVVGSGSPKTLLHRQSPAFRRQAATLARRLKALRKERRWTIERAAEKFGIEPAHVRRVEGAHANPSLAVLVSVARAFGLSVSALLEGHER